MAPWRSLCKFNSVFSVQYLPSYRTLNSAIPSVPQSTGTHLTPVGRVTAHRRSTSTTMDSGVARMAAGCRGMESTQDEVAGLPASLPVAVTVHKNVAAKHVSFAVGGRFHGPVHAACPTATQDAMSLNYVPYYRVVFEFALHRFTVDIAMT